MLIADRVSFMYGVLCADIDMKVLLIFFKFAKTVGGVDFFYTDIV